MNTPYRTAAPASAVPPLDPDPLLDVIGLSRAIMALAGPPVALQRYCAACHRCSRPGCTDGTHPDGEPVVRVGKLERVRDPDYGAWQFYRCETCRNTWAWKENR